MKLMYFMLCLISINTFSQGRFEFKTVDKRTPTGWDIIDLPGDVVFEETENGNTISIITSRRNYKMYVKTNNIFVREYNFLYTLIDDDGDESSVRIILKNGSWDEADFYFYSDRPGEKYFRLKLKKCKY